MNPRIQSKTNKEQSNNQNILKIKSPSKINLALWIKEKRPDNYHEIETIFFENNDLYDEISIDFKKDDSFSLSTNFTEEELNKLIPQDKNLAYKAAQLFFEKIKTKGICNITINKNIPQEAGLGGGSSNAAYVLKGLNEIFNYPLEETNLLNIANELGSDIPFFIKGGTCLAKGRGEILTQIENNLSLEVKIIKPKDLNISTKWAYEQLDGREFFTDHTSEITDLVLALKNSNYELFFNSVFNDFEMAIFSYFPELLKIRKALIKEGYQASGLCGSGSAIYGIRKKA